MRYSRPLPALILGALLACNATCVAQPCGSIDGAVQWVAGAPPLGGRKATSPIADATVTLRPAQGGAPVAQSSTGQDGRFSFACVVPGRYVIAAAGDQKTVTVTPNGVIQVYLYRRIP
jgi:hypothetical protein